MEIKILWARAWSLLEEAAAGANRPYRHPVVGSSSPTGHPRSRTVILRKCKESRGELTFYTDRRSAKARDLAAGSDHLTWTFWDPGPALQFTGCGPARWLEPAPTAAIFARLPKHARKAYAAELPPGSPLPAAGDGLPPDWPSRSLAETDYALANFGVLVTRLETVDILSLHRTGNHRLRGRRDGKGAWTYCWCTP